MFGNICSCQAFIKQSLIWMLLATSGPGIHFHERVLRLMSSYLLKMIRFLIWHRQFRCQAPKAAITVSVMPCLFLFVCWRNGFSCLKLFLSSHTENFFQARIDISHCKKVVPYIRTERTLIVQVASISSNLLSFSYVLVIFFTTFVGVWS